MTKQTQKHFVDQNGNYLGVFVGGEPERGIEVPVMPEDGRQIWNFESGNWLYPINAIEDALKDHRDNLWRFSTITLSNGAILKVNERTRADIADVYDGMMAAGLSEYDGWSADNGFFTMDLQDFQEAKVKGLQVVAKAFNAYKSVLDNHAVTPYTNLQDAVDKMTTLFDEA